MLRFRFVRPEYIFRPSQILRRMRYGLSRKRRSTAVTPWGLVISFNPEELHGRAMLTLGLSDLRTCEVISRIVQPGDVAVDVGANIGIMTSLMAKRAGPEGAVLAFEPQPATYDILRSNASAWNENYRQTAKVGTFECALSDRAGKAELRMPRAFSQNSGLASLESRFTQNEKLSNESRIRVDIDTLDSFIGKYKKVKLVKIDVEGHEEAVINGSIEALSDHKIDYILFEEHRATPTDVTIFLEDMGYSIFQIDRTFWRIRLTSIGEGPPRVLGEANNLLAVRNGIDVSRLEGMGWTCLRL